MFCLQLPLLLWNAPETRIFPLSLKVPMKSKWKSCGFYYECISLEVIYKLKTMTKFALRRHMRLKRSLS